MTGKSKTTKMVLHYFYVSYYKIENVLRNNHIKTYGETIVSKLGYIIGNKMQIQHK